MVLSASPVELIRLLYQKAIASTRAAREHLKNKRVVERCAAVNNAYLVVDELAAALRHEVAPDLAQQLDRLYRYIQARLLEANMSQQDQALEDALTVLITLSESWTTVSDPRPAAADNWVPQSSTMNVPGQFAVSA
jgi:flagellar protein FliS